MKHRLLLYLAKKGCLHRASELSTNNIAKHVDASQQSVSRQLINLEEQGYIVRDVSYKGINIKITEKGKDYLSDEFTLLKEVLAPKTKIKGNIFKGVGEGSYYMKRYASKIRKTLGFTPYSGTLNVRVNAADLAALLTGIDKIEIKGFRDTGRTFGTIKVFRVIVGGIEAAIVRPERSHYDENVAEIIGPSCFRTSLNLKEGDSLEIHRYEG